MRPFEISTVENAARMMNIKGVPLTRSPYLVIPKLGGSFVKGHIGGLHGPEVMQQNRQLTSYRNDSLVPGLLALP
jgi:hypothetical protein